MKQTMLLHTCRQAGLRSALVASAAAFALTPLVPSASAQDSRIRDELLRQLPRSTSGTLLDAFSFGTLDSKRAVIGVTMAESNRSDTLGVLVSEVTAGSPAEKAGIKEGSRITSINGVSLRISGADAADPALDGLAQRRLLRELAKAKPGDEVELRITSGASAQSVKLKTVSAAELNPPRSYGTLNRRGDGGANRASLGVSLGTTGSARDTLGLFISSVITDGPAEKAGVFEGDRIAAINGVDVRVPREDAEDYQSSTARVNRFTRELEKLAPGDKLTLRVYGGGLYREVQLTAGNSSELRSNMFMFNFGDGPSVMTIPGGQGIRVRPPSGEVRTSSPGTLRRGASR